IGQKSEGVCAVRVCDERDGLRVFVCESGSEVALEQDGVTATHFKRLLLHPQEVLHLVESGGGLLKQLSGCVVGGHCASGLRARTKSVRSTPPFSGWSMSLMRTTCP